MYPTCLWSDVMFVYSSEQYLSQYLLLFNSLLKNMCYVSCLCQRNVFENLIFKWFLSYFTDLALLNNTRWVVLSFNLNENKSSIKETLNLSTCVENNTDNKKSLQDSGDRKRRTRTKNANNKKISIATFWQFLLGQFKEESLWPEVSICIQWKVIQRRRTERHHHTEGHCDLLTELA